MKPKVFGYKRNFQSIVLDCTIVGKLSSIMQPEIPFSSALFLGLGNFLSLWIVQFRILRTSSQAFTHWMCNLFENEMRNHLKLFIVAFSWNSLCDRVFVLISGLLILIAFFFYKDLQVCACVLLWGCMVHLNSISLIKFVFFTFGDQEKWLTKQNKTKKHK